MIAGTAERSSDSPKVQAVIQSGQVLVYRVFDIADEIDLAAVERILKQNVGEGRVRIAAGKPQAVLIIRNAPFRLQLRDQEIQVQYPAQGGQLQSVVNAQATATIWDYGAVSICFQFPLLEVGWQDAVALGDRLVNQLAVTQQLDRLARQRLDELFVLLKDALRRPMISQTSEDYVIYFLHEVRGIQSTTELVQQTDLPSLLLGETQERLSERTREGVLQNLFQYSSRDCVVIDWNSAIVYEPSRERDIVDVLEFALAHLLEVRFYDDLLDRKLTEVYDAVRMGRERLWKNPFEGIARDANTRFIEFSEFMERIENSLKVVGDFYLATIFRAAGRRFRIPDWQQSITRKMDLLARVSGLLQGETNVRRSLFLEIAVVILFAFEIATTLIKALYGLPG